MSGKSKVECACVPSLDRQQLRGGSCEAAEWTEPKGGTNFKGSGGKRPKCKREGPGTAAGWETGQGVML